MVKPLPALGFVIGIPVAYAGIVAAQYATTRLLLRMQTYRFDASHTLPWIAMMVAIALVLGGLMIVRSIGPGVTAGAGAFLSVVGLVMVLLPPPQAFELSDYFRVPGSKFNNGVMLFDGSFIVLGIPLLLVGIRRCVLDAKLAKLPQGPGALQNPGYQQQNQWGGYPGQPQPQDYRPHQPGQPQHSGQPQHPGQQPPQYPGQQPRQ
ncbi:hypothetical protein GCM10009804_71860 [Kribbella hippodromi]|uniref:Uncharacterized protein n=1 Tax=Kribbella hippodromi TaxID=434347 RepID=A0ABN2EH82_9ACTN